MTKGETQQPIQSLKAWIQAFRLKTLSAALVPVFVGTALSYHLTGSYRLDLLLTILLAALCIQIATNLINDAYDFKKGADTQDRMGPQRVTQAGLFSFRQVLSVGFVFLFLALVLGIYLVIEGGLPILVIGICSLVLAFLYTGGPFPLAYKGLGDLFVLLFFGWISVLGTSFLHMGTWSLEAWLAGTQVGLLAVALIAINNLRDHVSDRAVGKNTLAVRLGESGAKLEIGLCLLLPFVLGFFWWWRGDIVTALLPWLAFPLALRIVILLWKTPPSPRYNEFLAQTAGLHMLFGLLLIIGWVLEL